MATILGTSFFSTHLHHNIDVADTLSGTAAADYIDGGGNDDTIYAGAGNDTVYGGSGNDTIEAGYNGNPWTAGHYGNDYVYGGSGNDFINYSWSSDAAYIWGDGTSLSTSDGNDTIWGSSAGDWIYGGNGDDTIHGYYGNDIIYGDQYDGGAGSDVIEGGGGMDRIYTGGGDDRIVYNYGDSPATYVGSDIIYDFNMIHDHIDMPVAGTGGNYTELTVSYGSWTGMYGMSADNGNFYGAQGAAQTRIDEFRDLAYVFVTNGHDGYLFADTNLDNHMDFAIELKGLTSLNDFASYSIV